MQGFNMGRYVPPDQEGLTSGNKLANKHPLGARARHLRTTGALIVRFEMPFAIWCTTCKPHETIIGQGVRFNAEKKKVGNYYSTPVYSFRMRHTACGGCIEIRTDPKNTAYVVTEGARKRDMGDDGRELEVGEIAIRRVGEDEGVKDAFDKLEGKVEDKRRAETERDRILELQSRQARDWEDPYEKSRRLRRTFRTERKGLEKAEAKREAIKDKMSLGIELVDETEEDRLRAGMVDFGGGEEVVGSDSAAQVLRVRPMFEKAEAQSSVDWKGKRRRPKTTELLAERKTAFHNQLTGNTRAVKDPFLVQDSKTWQPEIKRRKVSKPQIEKIDVRESTNVQIEPSVDAVDAVDTVDTAKTPATSGALVDYRSDSD